MKRSPLCVMIAMCVLCVSGASVAKPLTAGQLLGTCLGLADVSGRAFKSEPNSAEGIMERGIANAYCMGWIIGAFSEIQLFEGMRISEAKQQLDEQGVLPDWSTFRVCLPVEGDPIDDQTEVDTVINYIKRHPNVKSSTARIVVLSAFVEAYPCKRLPEDICRYVPCKKQSSKRSQ